MRFKDKASVGSITDLTNSEREIILSLYDWNFQLSKANSFNIAKDTKLATSTVTLGLRSLAYRGIVVKSPSGVYHLISEVAQQLKKDLKTGSKLQPMTVLLDEKKTKYPKPIKKHHKK